MQNTARPTVRLRPRETTRTGFLIRLGALVGSTLLLLLLCGWLWHIGWPQRQVQHVANGLMHLTQKAHFAVKDIVIEGRGQTSKDAIFGALGTSEGAPILDFDTDAAEARLAKLPWVANATVERRLPDGIVIRLTERVPMARWQHQNRTVVIDADGQELPDAPLDRFSSLPLVVGDGAPAASSELFDALANYPAVASVTESAVRVGERRWDLYLQPGVVARMPEKDLPDALKRLSQLITGQKILDRAIVAIDLRLPDRFSVEEAPNVNSHAAGDAHQ
jgi:cell division protein FtsQ